MTTNTVVWCWLFTIAGCFCCVAAAPSNDATPPINSKPTKAGSKPMDGTWETDGATRGTLDAAGIDLDVLMANMDEKLRRQAAAMPNNLNEGKLWGRATQICLSVLGSLLLLSLLIQYCQRRSEEYRTKYLIYQAKKRRRLEKMRQRKYR